MSDHRRRFSRKEVGYISSKLRDTMKALRERSGEQTKGKRSRRDVEDEDAKEREREKSDESDESDSDAEGDASDDGEKGKEEEEGDDVFRIKQEIKLRKNMLLAKKTNLSDRSKMNDLLRSVKKDYSKYHRKMRDDKKQLHAALSLLKQYMDDLVTTEKLVGKQFEVAKEDQNEVLGSINKIKKELNQLEKDDAGDDDDDESDDD